MNVKKKQGTFEGKITKPNLEMRKTGALGTWPFKNWWRGSGAREETRKSPTWLTGIPFWGGTGGFQRVKRSPGGFGGCKTRADET